MTSFSARNFLEIPYDELEILNLEAKEKAINNVPPTELEVHYSKYLKGEDRIKAVTVCFSDIEGRFHMIDYDKKFLLKSNHNLTFDGSSIRGFSTVDSSDLRLELDWASFRWLPSDVFGPGKVIMFAYIKDKNNEYYISDMRSRLKLYIDELKAQQGFDTNIAVECEGFLLEGLNAEQFYSSREGFKLVSYGGYYNSLPREPLKIFIDAFAEAQRAMGFENEKDHPEVAPSQFELNYKYCNALLAADQLQIYKLLARQVAANMGMTASFLPKPISGINGSGLHTNISLSKNGVNIFYDAKGVDGLSQEGWDMVNRLLYSAQDLCLVMNPSVNAYRRLDPHFEAPNQIKASANDRTSMVRIPLGDKSSARIEVRTVAPDANPYMNFYLLLRVGLEGPGDKPDVGAQSKRQRTKVLPDSIQDAARNFKNSDLIKEMLGIETRDKFLERKRVSANRCPRELGTLVKTEEVIFHHEVTNQYLWSRF